MAVLFFSKSEGPVLRLHGMIAKSGLRYRGSVKADRGLIHEALNVKESGPYRGLCSRAVEPNGRMS